MIKNFLIFAVLVSLCIGCDKGRVPRTDIRGTVTWKGQAIPKGYLILTPDKAKGNDGPQGAIFINDGLYDSRKDKSKPPVKGPQVVQVIAYTNKNVSKFKAFGDEMFSEPPTIRIDVPNDGGEINITIPESAQLAKTSNSIE